MITRGVIQQAMIAESQLKGDNDIDSTLDLPGLTSSCFLGSQLGLPSCDQMPSRSRQFPIMVNVFTA
jgi:hypothetical protein